MIIRRYLKTNLWMTSKRGDRPENSCCQEPPVILQKAEPQKTASPQPQKAILKQKKKKPKVSEPEMIVVPLERIEQKPQARKRIKKTN